MRTVISTHDGKTIVFYHDTKLEGEIEIIDDAGFTLRIPSEAIRELFRTNKIEP